MQALFFCSNGVHMHISAIIVPSIQHQLNAHVWAWADYSGIILGIIGSGENPGITGIIG